MIDRRGFLGASLALLASPLSALARTPARPRVFATSGDLPAALESSPYVYVSPLRSDGSESSCHAEVWYAWLDGAVVLITARTAWKARALEKGLDRARIWVGDYGRWKRLVGRNEAFREGPSYVARAERSDDAALLDRMLASYDGKYPAEIGSWRDRMRTGFETGERVLLRYVSGGLSAG